MPALKAESVRGAGPGFSGGWRGGELRRQDFSSLAPASEANRYYRINQFTVTKKHALFRQIFQGLVISELTQTKQGPASVVPRIPECVCKRLELNPFFLNTGAW